MNDKAAAILDGIKATGRVTTTDIVALRRLFFIDGLISRDEAETILAIEQSIREFADGCQSEWSLFLIDSIVDYIVHQAEPGGYISQKNADWLLERIASDGYIRAASELELLVKVIEASRWTPTSLTQYALEQVKHQILTGVGPIAGEHRASPGRITAAEVDMLRRILFAAGGEGNISISRAEAETLFDINDVSRGADNDPAWSELFVKAIANHVLAASGYKPPSREEALRREAWLAERGSVGDFLGRMVSGGFSGIFAAYKQQSSEERAMVRLDQQHRQILLGEQVTAEEADWLADRIMRDGERDANELAILRFIKETSPSVPPALAALIEAA